MCELLTVRTFAVSLKEQRMNVAKTGIDRLGFLDFARTVKAHPGTVSLNTALGSAPQGLATGCCYFFVRDSGQTVSVTMRRTNEFRAVTVHLNLSPESRDRKVDGSCDYPESRYPKRPQQFIAVHHNVATFREVA